MKELNEKIARWAGWKDRSTGCGARDHLRSPTGYCLPFPNFTESLDACFRWVVPKLRGKTDILLSMAPDDATAKRTGLWHCDILLDKVYIGEAESPALAFCLAVEKLIDSEATK